MNLFDRIKNIWAQLSISIYQGERFKNNMRALKYAGFVFGTVMLLFVPFNFVRGFILAGVATLLLGVGFIGSVIISIITQKRDFVVGTITVITTATITIYTFNGTNEGFAILWSLLIPVCIMYFFSVKLGILQSIYLELLFIVAFSTPLRDMIIKDKYSEVFIHRYPVLYGTAVFLFSLAMVQYHIGELRQIQTDEILKSEVEKQTRKSEHRRMQVENMSKQLVMALAGSIDAKDKYTSGHSTRVAQYSSMIAERSGQFDENDLLRIEYAAILHDVGKIGIPDSIINKQSSLTDEEYEVIKSHPLIGADILRGVTEMPDISVGAKWHHERFDGKGYPDGLKGEDIPVIARIICVADLYDAMTSNRSYRDYLPQEYVKKELVRCRGTQLDPEFTDIMLDIIDEDSEYMLHE